VVTFNKIKELIKIKMGAILIEEEGIIIQTDKLEVLDSKAEIDKQTKDTKLLEGLII
jgi:hypothetical protein